MLDLWGQFIRCLAADSRDFTVRDVMPLLLFAEQFFPDDAQGPMDQHAQVGGGKLIARPFFQPQAVAGIVSKGTAAVLLKLRDRPPQSPIGSEQAADQRLRQGDGQVRVEQALHGADSLMAPAMLPGPVIESPPDGIDGLAFRSRPQMTGQVVQRCRQSQQILGFLTGRHFRIFADDAGCIALITELMDPRRLFQGAAIIVSDDIRYDESFTGPGRA